MRPRRTVRIAACAALALLTSLPALSTPPARAATPTEGETVAGGNGAGDAANQFNNPLTVDVDDAGNVYVADGGNARVMRWAPGAIEGEVVAGGNGVGSALNQFYEPYAVAVDGSGNVYVSDAGNNRIVRWAPGATEGVNVTEGVFLAAPRGVAVDDAGNVFFSDMYHRVVRIAPDGTTTWVAGLYGEGALNRQLANPMGLDVDAAGNLYVADWGNHRVMRWAPGASEGVIVAGGRGPGPQVNRLSDVWDIAVDDSGNVFVADINNHRVMRWAPGADEGVRVAGGNGPGSAANQLDSPYSVALDALGNIYIADGENNRIQRWWLSDTPPPTGSVISGTVWTGTIGNGPVEGAPVQACPEPGTLGPCRWGATTAADGSFSVPGVPDGEWRVTAFPPNGGSLKRGGTGAITVADDDVTGIDVVLSEPAALPPGVEVQTAARGAQSSGVPSANWDEPITLRVDSCADAASATATFTMSDGYTETIPLTKGPGNVRTGTFSAPSPHYGAGTVTWSIDCGIGASAATEFDIYIDPSGVVLDQDDQPVEGATVTLYRSNTSAGPFVAVPDGSAVMSPSNRANPDVTGSDGRFQWDVIAGYYKVRAQKAGCASADWSLPYAQTSTLLIPPPVTDLVLRLACDADAHAVSVGDVSVLEGNAASTSVKFAVTLREPADTAVTVSYTLEGISATGGRKAGYGADFLNNGGLAKTITFKPSPKTGLTPTSATITAKIVADTQSESDETFAVHLINGTAGNGAHVAMHRADAIGTIIDDDGVSTDTPLGIGGASIAPMTQGAAKLQLPVNLAAPVDTNTTVTYTITDGTATYSKLATGGGDYGAGKTTGTITIKAGKTAALVTVMIWPKAHATDRTFTIALSNLVGAGVELTRPTGTATLHRNNT